MGHPGHILVVEDQSDMARVLTFNLESRGHSVTVAPDGKTALGTCQTLRPALVLLDLRLPDMSGLDVLRELQRNPVTRNVPVIIVSALGDEATVVEGLNLGADDYVTKPFRVRELLARVTATLRRSAAEQENPIRHVCLDQVALDLQQREASVAGMEVSLTRTEFDLLAHLLRHPGRVFTRKQLCHRALDVGDSVQERTIDAHIRTIRRKLGAAGQLLVTVWGVGYKALDISEAP